jgi:hypothetical protein
LLEQKEVPEPSNLEKKKTEDLKEQRHREISHTYLGVLEVVEQGKSSSYGQLTHRWCNSPPNVHRETEPMKQNDLGVEEKTREQEACKYQ